MIEQMKLRIEKQQIEIETLLRKLEDCQQCGHWDDEDELVAGECDRYKIRRKLHKKMEHFDEFVRERVNQAEAIFKARLEEIIAERDEREERLTKENLKLKEDAKKMLQRYSEAWAIEKERLEVTVAARERIINDIEKRTQDLEATNSDKSKKIKHLEAQITSLLSNHKHEIDELRKTQSRELE